MSRNEGFAQYFGGVKMLNCKDGICPQYRINCCLICIEYEECTDRCDLKYKHPSDCSKAEFDEV
jgi:hypothetical protein